MPRRVVRRAKEFIYRRTPRATDTAIPSDRGQRHAISTGEIAVRMPCRAARTWSKEHVKDTSVVILLADGSRPDTLASAMDAGALPALARLRDEGSFSTVTTVFPSVTGPAYTPFLMGRYPGPVGLPGLRWFDRTRQTARGFGNCRSYVGLEMRYVDSDLDPAAPTLFELTAPSVGALSVIRRGLQPRDRIGRGVMFAARAGRTHFSGNVRGWLAIDRHVGSEVARRIRLTRPRFVFAALTGIDKASHASGHASDAVRTAMHIVDETVAEIRHDAERAGRWESMQLWIASDHGHSPVASHDDLADLIRSLGHATIAHPWTFARGRDAAVMVSGNAMAHVYLELDRPVRPWWPELRKRWSELANEMLGRPSVDLLMLPCGPDVVEIRSHSRGAAQIISTEDRVSYRPLTGDPLGIGAHEMLTDAEAYEVCSASDYPDALVQVSRLASAPRSGEMILSATRGWDFRSKHEPIPHVSSHGALHADHMRVPLLTSRPTALIPRRTVDVMPSALVALGLGVPSGLDGASFIERDRAPYVTQPVSADLARGRADDDRDAESAVA